MKLAFKVNSNNHGYKKSNHPFNNIIFITRNSITKGINLRLNLINFGIKVRLNLINFAIKLSYLLTSSKNREVKVSGFKKGFNEHFSLFFIKAAFLKTFNVFMSIKSFIMHSNLFVFHKKVSSVIRNSCNEYSIDIEINLEESNALTEANRSGRNTWLEKVSSNPTRSIICDQFKLIKPLLQIIAIVLMVACNIEKAISEPCVGKFVNPIKDICWSCIFPVKLGNTAKLCCINKKQEKID